MAKETEVGPRGKKAPKELSRREFVKGAAVGAVAVAGAGALASCAAPTPEVIKETVEVPVEVTKIVEVPVPGEAAVFEVYPPYGVPTIDLLAPVARLDTLEGKTICGLWGGAFHFEETFPVIAELLAKKYPTATFIGPDVMAKDPEFGPLLSKGTGKVPTGWDAKDPELVANIINKYKCDAVISGNGC